MKWVNAMPSGWDLRDDNNQLLGTTVELGGVAAMRWVYGKNNCYGHALSLDEAKKRVIEIVVATRLENS